MYSGTAVTFGLALELPVNPENLPDKLLSLLLESGVSRWSVALAHASSDLTLLVLVPLWAARFSAAVGAWLFIDLAPVTR